MANTYFEIKLSKKKSIKPTQVTGHLVFEIFYEHVDRTITHSRHCAYLYFTRLLNVIRILFTYSVFVWPFTLLRFKEAVVYTSTVTIEIVFLMNNNRFYVTADGDVDGGATS